MTTCRPTRYVSLYIGIFGECYCGSTVNYLHYAFEDAVTEKNDTKDMAYAQCW